MLAAPAYDAEGTVILEKEREKEMNLFVCLVIGVIAAEITGLSLWAVGTPSIAAILAASIPWGIAIGVTAALLDERRSA